MSCTVYCTPLALQFMYKLPCKESEWRRSAHGLATLMRRGVCKSCTVNGDPYDSRNYRPISLLPIISKLLEKVVHRQLVEHLQHPSNAHGLPHEQFAYRHHHSCEDALTLAVNNWQLMLDEGSVCGVVFADMSKAFDRVDHGLLIQDLHELGISGIPLRWFCSYLSSRFQRVTTPTATADTVHCSR